MYWSQIKFKFHSYKSTHNLSFSKFVEDKKPTLHVKYTIVPPNPHSQLLLLRTSKGFWRKIGHSIGTYYLANFWVSVRITTGVQSDIRVNYGADNVKVCSLNHKLYSRCVSSRNGEWFRCKRQLQFHSLIPAKKSKSVTIRRTFEPTLRFVSHRPDHLC